KYILDDIELFEVKHLAILSSDIQVIIDKLHLDGCVFIPNLEDVINILDPDGMKIATFYIYDSYNERLKELRRLMKEREEFDEALFAEASSIEDEVRAKLSMRLSKYADDLEAAQKALAFIDLNLAKAFQMIKMNLVFPMISYDGETEYKGLFNPEIKNILDEKFQPIDIRFGMHPTIIMGTNMGGKTVVLKTLALCQYLFQYGFGIPAAEAKIIVQNEVFLCTTDEQSVQRGLSSFAAEMKNIDEIVKTSKMKTNFLALIDEPARTTNPTEGTALVSALVKVLQEKQMSLIIVTHYNINTYNNRCLRVRGFENGCMNYELVEVKNGEVPHEALNIAESLGVDKEWLEEARRVVEIDHFKM
ncbi:MAG: DNA mismatch repair protein MutS, partial [Bacteroidales bacterium]|nr:DNA mismatch repair protein MutS [Bacteroidales bacterium]